MTLKQLWEARARGCEEARTALIERHAYLVKGTLRRLQRAPERFHDDLMGAGRLALVKAVDRYDPAQGVAFPSFAIRLILGEMLEWLRADDWAPRSVRAAAKRGEAVTVLQQVSLESIVYGDGTEDDLTLLDRISDWEDTPDVIVPSRLEQRVIHTLVCCLPRRERKVVELYYWEEETHRQIGERLGISESTAHNVHQWALVQLRAWLAGREPSHAGR